MKTFRRSVLALLMVLGIIGVAIAPAGAASEGTAWLNINNPGTYCGYSYASVDTTPPAVNSALYAGYGQTIVKANNPCIYQPTTLQSTPANWLLVSISVHCRWGGTGDTVLWNSPQVGNAAGNASVAVGLPNSTLTCTDPDHLGLEMRTVVNSFYFSGVYGYVAYSHTTHWVHA